MIDFHEIENEDCTRDCDRDQRKITTENDLCKKARSKIDGLPLRCVGEWSRAKVFLLTQYFGIFSTGMSKKWNENINYIEICSGPGRCIDRSSGTELDGTSLCIINHKAFKYLRSAFFFDSDSIVIDTLNQRLATQNKANARAYIGDYDNPDRICDIINTQVDKYSLNLVFIDPTDCSLPFIMIESLRRNLPHVDLIVNVATGTDFNRNIGQVLLKPDSYQEVKRKYISFLGRDTFFQDREMIELATRGDYTRLRYAFREDYVNSLREIGYEFFGIKQVRHYYDIVFASSDKKGLEFWEKATQNEYDGQRTLNLS